MNSLEGQGQFVRDQAVVCEIQVFAGARDVITRPQIRGADHALGMILVMPTPHLNSPLNLTAAANDDVFNAFAVF